MKIYLQNIEEKNWVGLTSRARIIVYNKEKR